MPAEQCCGLDDHERLSPRPDAAGEEQEREAIASCEVRLLDLRLQDHEPLKQEGILRNEF
jgi:hypothetical protein